MINIETKRFSNYLLTLRNSRKITLEKLCEGVCSFGMAAKIERGERIPNLLLRQRLLNRLGISGSDFQIYVSNDEYQKWTMRQLILKNIVHRNVDESERMLQKYSGMVDSTDCVAKQFVLSMHAQLMMLKKSADEQILCILRQALNCTVVLENWQDIKGKILSVQEINLISECIRYDTSISKSQFYRLMIQYIDDSHFDDMSKAYIYPKVLHYLYECMEFSGEDRQYQQQFLCYCDMAIDILRNTGKMYYFMELLYDRKRIYEMISAENLPREDAILLTAKQKENNDWIEVFQKLYQENEVPEFMYEYAYLYREGEVYSIGKVIASRRKMLHLTQEQLCEGICSVKTLRRIEHEHTTSHMPIIAELFSRLNMTTEYQCLELVTDNTDIHKLIEELKASSNMHQTDTVDSILQQIKCLGISDEAANKQAIGRFSMLNEFKKGNLTKEQYLCAMKGIVEITIPLSVISEEETYLTNEELLCILNISIEIDDKETSKTQYINFLTKQCEALVLNADIAPYISLYEIIIAHVGSFWGNMGEYDRSNKISLYLLKEQLYLRRMNMLHMCIYDLTWNAQEAAKLNGQNSRYSKEQYQMDIKKCIVLSNICKESHYERFYKKKLDNIMNVDL